MTMLLGLRFLHFLSMALWIAGALRTTALLRQLSANPTPEQATRTGSAGPIGHIGAVGILASGLAMIIVLANMGVKVPPPIHASFVVALLLWGVQFYAERGLTSAAAAIAGGDTEAAGRLRTYRIATVVFHIGWTLLLALMVFRNVIA